jgi:hypothetical protein
MKIAKPATLFATLFIAMAAIAAPPNLAVAVAEQPLPVPPIPPRVPPLQDAPVPDHDALGPLDTGTPSPVTLNMGINRREIPNTSRGYPPGSSYRNDDDRRLLSIPGILLNVPFP